MQRRFRPLILLGAAAGAVVIIFAALILFVASRDGDATAAFVSRSVSSPDLKVEIASIDALLTSHPTARGVTLSDKDGVWLRIDRVEAMWSRFALIALKLDVDRVDIGQIELLRLPNLPAKAASAEETRSGDKAASGWLQNLPLRARLGKFALAQLSLGAPVLGVAATLSVDAAADLDWLGGAGRFEFGVRRLDAPGKIAVSARVGREDRRLQLSVEASEPAGGLIARLAKIPNLPPVEAHLDGAGTLDAFDATLKADAGGGASVQGRFALRPAEPAGRRLSFDVSARPEALLPQNLAQIFAGATTIAGVAEIADDGAKTLRELRLDSSAFRLDASGGLAADGKIAGRLELHGTPAKEGAAFVAKTLEAEADVSGSISRPDARLRLRVENAQAPFGRLGDVALEATAAADGALSNAASRLDVKVEGHAREIALSDPALAQALGEFADVSLRARVAGSGDADVGQAAIKTESAQFTFAGRAGPSALDGKINVAIPDLRRISGVAHRDLRGALTLAADLAGAPRDGRVAATLNGVAASLGTGAAALDGLMGQRVVLSGKVETLGQGGFSFEKLSLRGDHFKLGVDGAATREKADVAALIEIPDLRRADSRLTGRASARTTLTGSLVHPDAAYAATILGASVNGRPIPRLELAGDAHDLAGALQAVATLDGIVDGKAARGRLAAARAGGGWKADEIDFVLGGATAKGAFALDAEGLAQGNLSVAASNLDELSPLALQKLGGALHIDLACAAVAGGQEISLKALGVGLRVGDAAIEKLNAQISAGDLYRRPMLDGDIGIESLRAGKETVQKVKIGATPAAEGATLLDLLIDAHGFNIAGRSRLTPGEHIRLDVERLSAQRGEKRLSLAAPAVVSLKGGAVEVKGVSIAAGSGRIALDGVVGDHLDLVARAQAVPLSIAAIADPSLSLDGVLEADAHVTGSKSAPAGDWRVKISKATAPQLRANGLPAVDMAASGRLAGMRTTLDADIALGASSRLKIAGVAPFGGEGLDLAAKGAIDAALANTLLAANGQTIAGKATIDLRVTGASASPLLGGSVAIADGAFTDPLNGVALSKISGRIEGRGRDLTISGLTAQTKGGGLLAVAGNVTIAPDAGMPGSIHIASRKAQLVDTDIVSVTGDLDLLVSGALARAPKVSGKVNLASMEVSVPDRLPANLKPIPGTRHVDAKGFAAQMLALEAKEKAKAARHSSFDAALDLSLAAPSRIFVRGRGIDAELGGALKIAGTIQKPNVIGGFDLRRGKLQLLTQRIDITSGKLTFTGGLAPELDFAAETTAADVTAKIAVTGPAAMPIFAFTSSPDLPQDEVLSRLLFAKAAGSLSTFQALQLAAALAQLSGAGTGVDAFEKMRRALGVDSLDLEASGASGPTIGASRYIMEGVNVGVRTGAKPEQTSVDIGVDVAKKVRLQSETRVDGKTSVGVGVEVEY
jgi:translocation and assembly module TamB